VVFATLTSLRAYRGARIVAFAAVAVFSPLPTSAQIAAKPPADSTSAAYPRKPVRLISTFAPGGGASTVARMIAPELGEALGQSIVIDHRPGAGGSVGTELAARSQPDGYTLVMATASTIAINPLVGKVAFDPIRDFTAVVQTSTVPLILVVHPSVPAKSMKELVAYSRSPGVRLNYSSSGEGTLTHLASELLKKQANADMTHVPYKGGGQAIIDLMAGHVQVGFLNILEALPQVNAGRLRALALSSPARSAVTPNTPTVAEAGVPGFEVTQWSGVLGPARLPRAVVMRLNAEVNRILARPEMRARFEHAGAEPGGGSPEQFAALIKSEIAKWSGVVKTLDLGARR
jgi:tripartite-type tricarboxylate transporter receptor subunit TctC